MPTLFRQRKVAKRRLPLSPPRAKLIRVATDCSGMEAPIMALKNLGVPLQHVFASDIDKYAKRTILANHKPDIFYDDLCKRNNSEAPPCDIYVAGFPCQPFSAAGLAQGFSDRRGRGKIFFDICHYLEQKKPRVFVLENVRRILMHKGGKTFQKVKQTLEAVGEGAYAITWDTMNTKHHGVPQNRARVYIVGILTQHTQGKFEFPKPLEQTPSIELVLDPASKQATARDLPPAQQTTSRRNVIRALEELKQQGHHPLSEPWVVEIDCTTPRIQYQLGVSPCITCRRGSGHWITNRGRRMTKQEMLRLQGMDVSKFEQVAPDNQLGKLIGNTMSVNVLERLFVRLLPAAGLTGELTDRWESATHGGLCAERSTALKSVAIALRAAKKAKKVVARVAAQEASLK